MNQPYTQPRQTPGNPSVADTDLPQLRDLRKQLPLRVLSEADFQHWQTYGFVIVKQAVDAGQIKRTAEFLWEFQEMKAEAPQTWSRRQMRDHAMQELNGSGMVEAYHHQTFWDNRQTPRVVDAFIDIWDREDLWVTIDRANLNTPNQAARPFSGFIHWDADTSLTPLPVNVQGVLALSDTTPESGGFQCYPQLFKDFIEWRKSAPEERDPWRPDVATLPWEAQFVPMQAGDLLIFNSLLAHGIRPNTSAAQVRIAQYIAFSPAQPDNAQLRDWRVQSWRERSAPQGYAFPGDPREWEKTRYAQAQLSALGEKILGSSPY
ncbi:phytanoyl-CoA dioxygenase [Pseudomonas sp. ADAK18]|uniref:phytanoyl-CoA dioxygenase family protein n=1 Tax=Pseudomonas sp. ADAK18 TaxID=2730848 RepID=UPI001462DA4D|nr:phytanoyl-CoA dioxygenase family protein [Pseudomonas sp. ADAK18]QJI32112.1 phytanoyl-CoA dioxygenase [Pseudomonas sp. ADAK18]